LTSQFTNLTVSPAATTTYYVTVSGDGVCENAPGDAALLTVTVRTVSPPVVTNPTQTFCGDTDSPTLGSIEISGTEITWYESAASVTALAPNTPLQDGVTYYASQTDPLTGCESVDRAEVTVVLTLCDLAEELQITKTAASPTVFPGGEITYTISVINTASISMTDVIVTDVLDSQLIFVSASENGTADNGTVTWTIPTLAANTAMDLVLTVSVPDGIKAGTKISNVAVVTSPDDPDTPKKSDPVIVEVIDPLSFTIEKTPNVSEARIDDEVIYTIKVTNISSLVKEDIDVTDTLPTGLLYVNSDQGGIFVNGVVSWQIPSLAAGQNIELTLVSNVTDDVEVGDIIYNTAVVDVPGDDEVPTESDPGNGVLIIGKKEPSDPGTFITARKWTDVNKVAVGDLIDFTIRIENSGDFMAYNLTIMDSLPAGTMAMEASPIGEITDKTVAWTIDSLAVGAWMEAKVKLMALSNEGPMVNWAFISGRNFPDVSANTPPINPTNEVDLVLDKQVSASLIQLNSNFEYKITLTNNSDNTSHEVVVTDVLSTAVEYLGADVSSGTVAYDLATRTLTWKMVSVDPMVVETMTIRVKATSEGNVSNTATAVSDDVELMPSDNTDTVAHDQLLFKIPNVITSNGDGINDTWVIRGLDVFFQKNELMIVNRWGVEVYKSTNYQHDWNGENLNGGTYFYRFQLTDIQGGSHTMTGYVTLIK